VHGIIGFGGYVPYRRLDLTTVSEVAGGGGRKGTRSVASFDEDATTMAVEAARVARRRAPGAPIDSVWFATVAPPYLDKTNATVVQAALRLPMECGAYDLVGSVRGAMGALRAAASQPGPALAVAADVRTGLAGGPDESYFGDGAGALVLGGESHGEVLAELGPWVSVTGEFVDRWRTPGEQRSRVWEERFGEVRYGELGAEALGRLWKAAGIGPDDVDHLIVTGTHGRACRAVAQRSKVPKVNSYATCTVIRGPQRARRWPRFASCLWTLTWDMFGHRRTKEPGDWKWRSFRHYALREVGLVEIESEWTARDREGQAQGERARVFLNPG